MATATEEGPPSGYCPEEVPWPDGIQLCRTTLDCGDAGTWTCSTSLLSGDGCPPPSPGAVACSTDADCDDGWSCTPHGPFGLGCPTPAYCTSPCGVPSCPDGYACDAASRMCEPVPCTAGPACSDGWSCNPGGGNEDARGCTPIACNAGYSCPGPTTCEPDAPGAGMHGCRLIHCSEPGAPACPLNTDCKPDAPGTGCATRACTSDADCDCGTCLNDSCAPRPGACSRLSSAG